jgi:hypothetical protein
MLSISDDFKNKIDLLNKNRAILVNRVGEFHDAHYQILNIDAQIQRLWAQDGEI